MTLKQAIGEYSADAMRFAMANAGDGMDDANYEHSVANAAILSITREVAWIEEVSSALWRMDDAFVLMPLGFLLLLPSLALPMETDQTPPPPPPPPPTPTPLPLASFPCPKTMAQLDQLRDEEPTSFPDRAFDNAINTACTQAHASFDKLLFRAGVQSSFHELMRARDVWRFSCGPAGLNRRLVEKYSDVFTRINAPIIPHTCEHLWTNVLKREGRVVVAGWPETPAAEPRIAMASEYIESMIPSWRKAIAKAEAPPKAKKGQPAGPPPPKVKRADIFFSEQFVGWQETTLHALAKAFDESSGSFPKDTVNQVMAAIKSDPALGGENEKALMKMVMPFAKFMMEKAVNAGPMVLDVKLPFPEKDVLEENLSYMMRSLNLEGHQRAQLQRGGQARGVRLCDAREPCSGRRSGGGGGQQLNSGNSVTTAREHSSRQVSLIT